jgi:hypothetical protein
MHGGFDHDTAETEVSRQRLGPAEARLAGGVARGPDDVSCWRLPADDLALCRSGPMWPGCGRSGFHGLPDLARSSSTACGLARAVGQIAEGQREDHHALRLCPLDLIGLLQVSNLDIGDLCSQSG